MNTIIRKAQKEDLEKILDINYYHLNRLSAEKWDDTLAEEWTHSEKGRRYFLNKIEDEDSCMFLAQDVDNIIGFVDGELADVEYRKPLVYAEMNDIVVIPEYQSKGIGKLLTETFLNWCKEKNVSYVTVSAYTENIKAIEFYKSQGFSDYGTELQIKLK